MSMTLDSFQDLVDRYGSQKGQWPSELRPDAEQILVDSAEARALLAEAQALENAFRTSPKVKAPRGLLDRICASVAEAEDTSTPPSSQDEDRSGPSGKSAGEPRSRGSRHSFTSISLQANSTLPRTALWWDTSPPYHPRKPPVAIETMSRPWGLKAGVMNTPISQEMGSTLITSLLSLSIVSWALFLG